ncbi:MAG: prepilin-type N-terminal cleavage/methylation domain-containing protein [Phycisphaeraceae bacterium]
MPKRQNTAPARPRRTGFSLVELLVVIAIIGIILSVAVPAMSRMMSGTKVESSRSTVSAAVATARAHATITPSFPVGQYRGSAVVFTPANEIRITKHRFDARDGGGDLLVYADRAGYADIADEPYAMIPRGVGVVGIARGDTNEPRLLTPPFAIRFNQTGIMVPGSANNTGDETRIVFYDYDEDFEYETSSYRLADYDVDEFDPEVVGKTAGNWDGERYLLPFGRLDAVIGVIVYDKASLRSSGNDLVGSGDVDSLNAAARTWILENGRPVFFNRYSGAGIKP